VSVEKPLISALFPKLPKKKAIPQGVENERKESEARQGPDFPTDFLTTL